MRSVTPEFLAAIKQPQTYKVEATLLDTRGRPYPLNLVDGTVTLDATQAIRGSCDLTIINEELIPEEMTDPLTPYGSSVVIRRGVSLPDGSDELVQLGKFALYTVSINDTGDSLDMQLTGYDAAKKIEDETNEVVIAFPAGTLFVEAILNVVSLTYGDVDTRGFFGADGSPTIDYKTPIVLAIDEQSSTWEFAQNMAMAIGCDLYFDGDGVLVLRSVFAEKVVDSITEGENGVLLHVGKQWDREGVHNKWVVTAEGPGETTLTTDPPVLDDDPASPTRYGGPFGKVVRYETIEYVDTTDPNKGQQQVNDVARLLKNREMGKAQGLDFGSVVNPALEPDDVVKLTRAKSRVDELRIIDSLQIPLTPDGEMTGTTRMLRVS